MLNEFAQTIPISRLGTTPVSESPTSATSVGRDVIAVIESQTRPEAFAEIFDRHWPAIHKFCVSRAGQSGEDLAAETFRIAFDQRDRFDQTALDARPWLFGIATNLVRRHFRTAERARRAEARVVALPDVDMADAALGRVEAELLGPVLADALASLNPADRDALLLHAWADLTYEQIAVAMDTPVGTVRSRINRARTRLQAHLTTSRKDQA